MKIYILIFLFLVLSFYQTFSEEKQKFSELGDFPLDNGKIIENLEVGYRTYGNLNDDSSNAILFPTWFGGKSQHLAGLIGKDKFLDSTKFFIIAVDAIGNGVSTSPSNSKTQKNNDFPVFSLHDVVRSQKKMLEKIGIDHLYGVIGGSMGGMQVFQWITAYPNFIDKAVAYTGSPKFTSYDKLYWETRAEIIELLENAEVSEKKIYEIISRLTYIAIQTPEYRARETSTENYDDFILNRTENYDTTFSSYDRKILIEAMLMQDVSSFFGGSMEKAAENVKADVLIISSITDHMVNPQPALDFANMIDAETLILYNDCGHLAVNCEMGKVAKRIREFFNKKEE